MITVDITLGLWIRIACMGQRGPQTLSPKRNNGGNAVPVLGHALG